MTPTNRDRARELAERTTEMTPFWKWKQIAEERALRITCLEKEVLTERIVASDREVEYLRQNADAVAFANEMMRMKEKSNGLYPYSNDTIGFEFVISGEMMRSMKAEHFAAILQDNVIRFLRDAYAKKASFK